MLKMVKLSIIMVLLSAAVGCGVSGEVSVLKENLLNANLNEYWALSVAPLLDDGEAITSLKLLDDKLYCLTDGGKVIAVHAAKGVVAWWEKIAGPNDKIMGMAHIDQLILSPKPLTQSQIMGWQAQPKMVKINAVVINTMSMAILKDRDKGTEYRRMDLEFSANCAAAIDRQNIYVGSTAGRVFALAIAEGLQVWGHSTDGMISAPIKVHAGNVYVASEDRHIYSMTPVAGNSKATLNWKQELLGAATAAPHVDLRGCFVPSRDGRVYAFDALGGKKLWPEFICQGALSRDIQVGESSIFQYADGDGLYAINISNGRKRWRNTEAYRVLGAFNHEVYVITRDKMLLALDEMLGEVKHKVSMADMDLFADNVSAPAIYAATSDGRLICVRRKEVELLTGDMLRDE